MDENNVIFQNIQFIYLQYPILSTIFLIHLLFRLIDPRPNRLKEVDIGAITKKSKIIRFKPTQGRHTIVVTGGCGLLGSEIVQQLLDENYNVKVLDLYISRTIDNPQCEYIQCDITKDDLTELLKDVDGIIHTAGVVCLSDNPNLLFNVNVVGTQRVLQASRLAGVQAFVYTSSSGAVTSPYAKYSQLKTKSNFKVDPNYMFPSHYSSTKYQAEQIVINANDNDYYRTCAIRIPGMYGTFADGTPDNVLIGPLISGGMSHVPTTFCKSETSLVDFVYVKNAAHVHQLALTSFLEDTDVDVTQICGKTFNCTNDDKLPKDTRENWNVFLYLYHQTTGIKNGEKNGKSLKPIPYIVVYITACVLEFIYFYCCGRVPFPRHFLWNATRCSVGYTITPITLNINDTKKCLKYKPLYTTVESFEDIINTISNSSISITNKEDNPKSKGKRRRASSRGKKVKNEPTSRRNSFSKSAVRKHDPSKDIDWTIPPLSTNFFQRMLDILAGPEMSYHDQLFTFIALIGTMYVSHCSAMKLKDTTMEFTKLQYRLSMTMALIDGSAAVQCITNASKRWYHVHGLPLQNHLKVTIIFETLIQCVILGIFFSSMTKIFITRTCLWFLICLVLIFHIPLHAQRPLAILLTLMTYWFLLLSEWVTMPVGMEWIAIVLPMKYFISHASRHEPYKY